MKKQNFLNKLRKEGKLELVESSDEMRLSYLQKAENCFKSAKILFYYYKSNKLLLQV